MFLEKFHWNMQIIFVPHHTITIYTHNFTKILKHKNSKNAFLKKIATIYFGYLCSWRNQTVYNFKKIKKCNSTVNIVIVILVGVWIVVFGQQGWWYLVEVLLFPIVALWCRGSKNRCHVFRQVGRPLQPPAFVDDNRIGNLSQRHDHQTEHQVCGDHCRQRSSYIKVYKIKAVVLVFGFPQLYTRVVLV